MTHHLSPLCNNMNFSRMINKFTVFFFQCVGRRKTDTRSFIIFILKAGVGKKMELFKTVMVYKDDVPKGILDKKY